MSSVVGTIGVRTRRRRCPADRTARVAGVKATHREAATQPVGLWFGCPGCRIRRRRSGGLYPVCRCPLRPMPAKSASASSAGGSATSRACATCSRRRSTSPACASPGAPAWWSAAARWGSRRSRACSPATPRHAGRPRRGATSLPSYAREGSIRWERREYRGSDLDGKFLAVAATSVTEVNIAVYEGRRAAGDALQRRRRAAAVQLHPARDRAHRPAGDRDLHRGRLAGARQAA